MSIRITDGVPWIGDRAYPWASRVDYADRAGFHERRFRLTFENGWTLSIVFGSGSYTENHSAFEGVGGMDTEFHEEVDTVEVAAWLFDGEMVMWEESGDTVRGHVPEAELLAIIEDVSQRPSRAVHA